MAFTVQGKDEVFGVGSLGTGQRHVDQPHGLLVRASPRPRDSRGRHRVGRPEAFARSFGHGSGHRFGDRAVLGQQLRGNAQQRLLGLVRIGDHAAQEVVGRPRHFGDELGDEAAGARLRNG